MIHPVVREDLEFVAAQPLDWGRFSGRTILVAGANGFLPSALVETFLYLNDTGRTKGTRVLGIVRNPGKAQARFARHAGRSDFRLIGQDVCLPLDPGERVDFIVHAASQASPKYYGKDPVGTLSANVLGTRNLLELARVSGAEGFLFFSSGEVYGTVEEGRIPIREDGYGYLDPSDVRSCYAESKRMGENMCVCWHHQFGVPARIVRIFHTYGPGMALDDGRVFADFVSDIVHGRDIVMKSDGSAIRPFCYLADAVAGFLHVMLKGTDGTPYNVGNPAGETRILDLAHLLVRLFPEKGLKVVRQESAAPQGYLKSPIPRNCPDIARIRALGWEPRFTLEEGFQRTVRSFET